ncbi:PHD finger protein 7-like isoform X2 [Neocloeon triangulifer]|uniref:PHD finger protein 7-like isoform X2 n=1 Tax=Neocloeon triangulifer TaxID=2078957 RepID=UPI00286F2F02|nr:PHD finger protein 7-like isoform X2 [Neocloeon triangulifer]
MTRRTIVNDRRMNMNPIQHDHSQIDLRRRCRVLLQRLDEETINQIKNKKYCGLCNRSPSDPLLYGKIYVLGSVTVHYYCLLFACALAQKGEDTEGIFGFLESDIKKQIASAEKVKCSYCDEAGASIICVQRMCKKVFHLPCGMEHGSQHNYFNKFESFCKQHRPNIKIPSNIFYETEPAICAICMEEAKKDLKCIHVLWAPCCKKNAWLHRLCVQKYALSSGYFFKCPRCNDKDEFNKAMLRYGIYVPESDASWELEGNQFQALYERYSRCDAELCLCPSGREEDEEIGNWEIILCSACGSQGIHVGCTKFKTALRKWYCTGCKPIIQTQCQDAETTALIDALISDNALPGPSSISDPIPCVAEVPEESAAVVERLPTAVHRTNPRQDCSQYSTEAIEIMVLDEEEEEIDIEILDEVPRPLQPVMEEIQEVRRVTANTTSGGTSSAKPVRNVPLFAIILDDDDDDNDVETEDDFEPEIVEDIEDLTKLSDSETRLQHLG